MAFFHHLCSFWHFMSLLPFLNTFQIWYSWVLFSLTHFILFRLRLPTNQPCSFFFSFSWPFFHSSLSKYMLFFHLCLFTNVYNTLQICYLWALLFFFFFSFSTYICFHTFSPAHASQPTTKCKVHYFVYISISWFENKWKHFFLNDSQPPIR